MTEDNRVSGTIAAADIAAILGKIAEIDALVPFAIRTGKDVLSACKRTFLIFLGMVASMNFEL